MHTNLDSKRHTLTLGHMRPGSSGHILNISNQPGSDLERGLLEMGFIEGAKVEVLHHGLVQRDPVAVRINHSMTVALRRSEAQAILVEPTREMCGMGVAEQGYANP